MLFNTYRVQIIFASHLLLSCFKFHLLCSIIANNWCYYIISLIFARLNCVKYSIYKINTRSSSFPDFSWKFTELRDNWNVRRNVNWVYHCELKLSVCSLSHGCVLCFFRADHGCVSRGTLCYVAPELLRSLRIMGPKIEPSAPFTKATDVFAFG